MITFKEYITEAKQVGKLYHYIDHNDLIYILKNDKMPSGTYELPLTKGFEKGGKIKFEMVYGISLTRLFKDRNMFRWYGDSIIEFDGNKLSEHYKIIPHNDPFVKNNSFDKTRQHQAEEFIPTEYGIKNISKYITKIYIPKEWLDMYLTSKNFNESELLSKFKYEEI